ncbi:MAG: S41 family peptidase [Clostridiales bacterium]|nr:S41 family peptidase [Clostridiales bacterium]
MKTKGDSTGMKKKWLLVLCLVLTACLLGGCTMLPLSGMDAMFRSAGSSATAVKTDAANTEDKGDTVTISREQYEKYKQFDELIELMNAADIYFYQEPDHEKMLQGASAGILAGLQDDYTFYYTPEQWEKMWEDDKGEYAGIGIMITANYSTGLCTISRVFKGSPAEEAGVQRGDILYKVNGELTVTADTLQDAVDIMRGTPGTTVDVTFLRNGDEITFTIPRANINVNQIEYTMLTEDVGYIALYEFAGKGEQEFEAAMKDLLSQNAKGLIIDLRDNPGGWVEQAQYIGDLFMDAGDLCYLIYRDGSEDHCYKTTDGKTDIPLVVLLNENSASSSEILSGALRDRCDATIVGVQSYGKGIVQVVLPVGNDGAGFQMTVAQYCTPSGYKVHKQGITPDVIVELEEGDNGSYSFADCEADIQLKKALETMQEKLK